MNDQDEQRFGSKTIWVLAALILVGAVLRIYHLGYKSLWHDEALIFHVLQGSWREILAMNVATNSSGPLYPLFLGSITGPGATEVALRLPSMIAGVIAIPLSYLLARQFTKSHFALLTPFLISIAPTHIRYSQEVREYSLSFCIAIGILLCFTHFISKQDTCRAWILAITISVGMAIQHGLIVLVTSLNLIVLFELRHKKWPARPVRLWLIAQLPGLAAIAAVYVTTISGQLVHTPLIKSGYLADQYWDGLASGALSLVLGNSAGILRFAFPGWIMAILFLLGLAFIVSRRSWHTVEFILVPITLTFTLALLGLYPYGGIRQDLFLLPMVYVCAAIAVEALSTWLTPRIGFGGVKFGQWLLISILAVQGFRETYFFLQSRGQEPMRPIVETLRDQLEADDHIYVHFAGVPAFRFYWKDRPEAWLKGSEHTVGLGSPERAEMQSIAVKEELASLVAKSGTLWIVFSHLPEEDVEKVISHVESIALVEQIIRVNGSYLYRKK